VCHANFQDEKIPTEVLVRNQSSWICYETPVVFSSHSARHSARQAYSDYKAKDEAGVGANASANASWQS
jgi:hypothetical protein